MGEDQESERILLREVGGDGLTRWDGKKGKGKGALGQGLGYLENGGNLKEEKKSRKGKGQRAQRDVV